MEERQKSPGESTSCPSADLTSSMAEDFIEDDDDDDETAAQDALKSYIVILDLSPDARILYASPSVKDVLGWEPEELLGKTSWEVMHPGEFEALSQLQRFNIHAESVAQMVSFQAKHKNPEYGNNGWLNIHSIVNVCYDIMIGICARSGHGKRDTAWKISAEDVVRVSEDGQRLEFENWNTRRTLMMETMSALQLDAQQPQQEPRTCLFLNRFTHEATILFMTAAALTVVETTEVQAVGKSFYEFVDDPFKEQVKQQIKAVKTQETVVHLRFLWKVPTTEKKIDCEAVVAAACDGLVCVIRRA